MSSVPENWSARERYERSITYYDDYGPSSGLTTLRTCQQCLAEFLGVPKAVWCPDCRPMMLRKIRMMGAQS